MVVAKRPRSPLSSSRHTGADDFNKLAGSWRPRRQRWYDDEAYVFHLFLHQLKLWCAVRSCQKQFFLFKSLLKIIKFSFKTFSKFRKLIFRKFWMRPCISSYTSCKFLIFNFDLFLIQNSLTTRNAITLVSWASHNNICRFKSKYIALLFD